MPIDRRKFLQNSGTLGGGLAAILASGRAPAYAQGTSLHWLRLVDFVPASDTLLRRELLPEAEKALGVKITFETINGNDLQARITSAIQSGTGADIIHALHNWPHLYAESVADVSDVAEEIAGQQGGFYDIFLALEGLAQRAVGRGRYLDLLPQVLVRPSRFHHLPRHLGKLPRGRQGAQGQGPADRVDARSCLR